MRNDAKTRTKAMQTASGAAFAGPIFAPVLVLGPCRLAAWRSRRFGD